ncbi:Yos1 family domain containing protein [Entamoeba histolytica HM-1:IMSS-B]|uniref:Yos1-like domain-containing protein n=8 Tax=Entamoeba TaxID=5758 RepID=B1N2M6_ENTH1|nr:hypothetical protein EHI_178640 [Entamoeba histolytica HM-1:IMSS]XP_008858529.1 Yos1 family domain containing protein [Entamoeba nuttalli P19]EMD49070.1 Yos1 family protein [Entamoeba histolytica KU27]EMH72172.1 Yos1 family domain containing protein [Entamoeba histolytica HM-1:IMSS-B]EMS15060.1 Yos1 family protein [Entamoeba histolytica HM-3:IMSS]ENY63269.1 Yos1 family protein, putative [Entamoeba histolytica HM-1:IMSS-A]GAT92386.1 yos1-like domain-containing protein [Entamoeba histolytica|eukprot:XP_008858529.1 Yos1 family domain containing protein [Entamoeba nuttalli P19]
MDFSFSFGGLLTSILLFVNSIVILNQQRLLKPLGIAYDDNNKDNEENKTVRGRLSWFFYRTQDLMKYPLIVLNTIVIGFLLILG